MQIKNHPDFMNRDYASLAIHTDPNNPNDTFYSILHLSYRWSPKSAKSFTVQKYMDVDFWGNPVDKITGYARIEIVYFTTKKEGQYPIVRNYVEAVKRYNKIYSKYKKDFAGGGIFGQDWPTLKINRPETYWEMKKLFEDFIAEK